MDWTRCRSVGWAIPGPKPNGLVIVCKHSNQPTIICCRKWINSRSAYKYRQWLSKEERDRAAGGYLGVASRRSCWRQRHGGRRFALFFFSLPFVFRSFLLLLLSFFLSVFSLYSALSLSLSLFFFVLFSLSVSSPFFLPWCLPCFYRQK